MLPQEIIAKKRDKKTLAAEDIEAFINGVVEEKISPAQIGAFTMAVLLNGMKADETVVLTKAMRDSGDVLEWHGFDRPIVDKHSTGGVGDNVSLMLAPALAACDVYNPMISGRGLGHTGGTLDKFDAIPGYQTQPDNQLFRNCVREIGCAIIGQTGNLAPADKRIYAIRDVCATVESIPLITASILSKKLAAGLDTLVLDVKFGSGAFMPDFDAATELANSLVAVANGAGVSTSALLTDMNQPLASAAGNAVEMKNAVDFLTGKAIDENLFEVSCALGGELLFGCGATSNLDDGIAQIERAFSSGRAAERFAKMVARLGGPNDFVERMDHYLEKPAIEMDVHAPDKKELTGRLGFDTRQLGLAVIELGGGRTRPQDDIDHAVGLVDIAERDWDGEAPICKILARNETDAQKAKTRILAAIKPAEKPVRNYSPVFARINN